MSKNQGNSSKATFSRERSQLTFWQELSETEQESVSGGKKVEAIIRPFKLDEVPVSVASQYGIRSIPTLM